MEIQKIFVASPSGKDNGGGESLHQLVDGCNRLGYESYIYYFDKKNDIVLEKMQIYNVTAAKKVEDNENNLLICPEMYTFLLKKYRYIRKCIWFLSLDYYLLSLPVFRTKHVLKKWKITSLLFGAVFFAVLMKPEVSLLSYNFKKNDVKYFLYNVEYAYEYIKKNARYDYMAQYLCGPINDIYFNEEINYVFQKERLVAYNPKKANAFTQKVINYIKEKQANIEFVPIQKMDQEGVKELLEKAAVYMDFGYFPGPERIPREAVMMRCNIITSNLGSAANDIDVPIKKKYKFELSERNIEDISLLIQDMIDNYAEYVDDYDDYREKVRWQKNNFQAGVCQFLKGVEHDKT